MKKAVFLSGVLLSTLVVGTHIVAAEESNVKKQHSTVDLVENKDPLVSKLEITSASDLNFGEKAIGINDMVLTEDMSPKVVVTDIRGDASGWHLGVSLGEFKDKSTERTLKGVQIFYPVVTMTTNSTINVAERTPESIGTDKGLVDGSVQGVMIESSEKPSTKTMIQSTINKGNGQWTATYDEKNKIELKIPAGNLAGHYEAELTYTLTDGPEA